MNPSCSLQLPPPSSSSSIIIMTPNVVGANNNNHPSGGSSRSIARRMSSLHSSRGSLAALTEDCPICLDEMKGTDLDHPLQCTIHCGFNMCKNCIESLIVSSKDDYQLASDGNRHVKVYLHCPNCRSNLSHTIRDTLLLRKVDEILSVQRTKNALFSSKDEDKEGDGNDDEERDPGQTDDDGIGRGTGWTPSQVRLERAMHTPEVQEAIQQARKFEAEYLGKDVLDDWFETEEVSDESRSFGEEDQLHNLSSTSLCCDEWGFEAEIDVGVHSSLRMPPPPKPVVRSEAIRIDPTLFAGLDYFLTDEQRLDVTELMTSGDPSRLARAAEILRSVASQLQQPQSQQRRQKPPLIPKQTSISPDRKSMVNRKKSIERRSSVFELIDEAKAAHLRARGQTGDKSEEKKVSETLQAAMMSPPGGGGGGGVGGGGRSRVAQHRQLERELHMQADFQKRFPIPVRMPKAIEIDLTIPLDMEFVDYTWNGTVTDAYSKISIGFRNHVTQRKPNNVNVSNMLGVGRRTTYEATTMSAIGCTIGLCTAGGCGDDDFDWDGMYIALPGEARILVSHTGRSGKQGAVRGDVVTHVDGQSVAGQTVSDFLELVRDKQQQQNGADATTIMITLNAERSVADALRRRAMAIAEM